MRSKSEERMAALLDAIKRVEDDAALMAKGFVVRVYRVTHDECQWKYGSLTFPDTAQVREHFKLSKNDKLIGWEQFKDFLVLRLDEQTPA